MTVAARCAPPENLYREVKEQVTRLGLLEPQPRYYLRMFTRTFALFLLPYALLFVVGGYWWAVGLGVIAAFASVQVGLAGHDIGHRQSPRLRPVWFNVTSCFVILALGMSRAWWLDKHNRHHAFPNQEGKDPDVMLNAIAFTQEQARQKRGLVRLFDRHQAFLFFPVLSLEGVHLRLAGLRYLFRNDVRMRKTEISLILLSVVWAVGLPIAAVGLGPGLVFAIVAQGLTGLYLGCIFAPNHKGMLMLGEDDDLDFFRRQVLTSRNVRPGRVTDYVYGALNYQIEHHLFPAMPRNQLGRARVVVRAFCAEKAVPYHETSVTQSFREILESLHEASEPLRSH
ncbi:MAG TPA: acyl-CoA desaturase [Gaiellaceae bacterium]|nr:acyl-CoA desaturase [Gaiellaceae bacterium]